MVLQRSRLEQYTRGQNDMSALHLPAQKFQSVIVNRRLSHLRQPQPPAQLYSGPRLARQLKTLHACIDACPHQPVWTMIFGGFRSYVSIRPAATDGGAAVSGDVAAGDQRATGDVLATVGHLLFESRQTGYSAETHQTVLIGGAVRG